MEHIPDEDFWEFAEKLPQKIQKRIPQKFELLRRHPRHPSLNFKKVGPRLWSVRITKGYRALALEEEDTFVWNWVGKHDEYLRRLRQLI